MVKRSNQVKAQVLAYWRAIEFFSPQTIPRIDPTDTKAPVFPVGPKMLLPWEGRHQLETLPLYPNQTWNHQIFCGVYQLESIRKILESELGQDSPDSETQPFRGESCSLSFVVDHNGQVLPSTLVISSCAWATARTLDPGPASADWLDDFDEVGRELTAYLGYLSGVIEGESDSKESLNGDIPPLSVAELLAISDALVSKIGATSFADSHAIRIKSYRVTVQLQQEAETESENDFLNSFYLNELADLSKQLRNGNAGRGLRCLLDGVPPKKEIEHRIDTRESDTFVLDNLAPDRFPKGRWPSDPGHPLYFSQQLASSIALSNLMDAAGLFSINGPPGTGKTTLIRDLVASIVVARAERLAQLKRPGDAFAHTESWAYGRYQRNMHVLREDLLGFEIVIASSNNGAVENVTLEIPARTAIADQFVDDDLYFADFAEQLLQRDAWALLSARLGNMSNGREFISRFWYGPERFKKDGSRTGSPLLEAGFLGYLTEQTDASVSWSDAVHTFEARRSTEARLRAERQQVYDAIMRRDKLQRELETRTADLKAIKDQQATLDEQAKHTEKVVITFDASIASLKQQRLEHRQLSPGFWVIVFTWGRALREWREQDLSWMRKIEEVEVRRMEIAERHVRQLQLVKAARERLVKAELDRSKIEGELATVESRIAEARRLFGDYIFGPEQLDSVDDDRELSSPWGDAIWNKARTDLFLAALQLHKAFIRANASHMRDNFWVVRDMISGGPTGNNSPTVIRSAWASLFMVIPVISTTFASFRRLFYRMGSEELGWVIIDEAGQASPQAAAGAIWRGRRTVVLGDPHQLEPVETLPLAAQQTLRRHYGVDEQWVPAHTSLQVLADTVNPIGTYLVNDVQRVWVGAPLRVHRRCQQPMFDICNQIAYGGAMVFGTPNGEESFSLPSSAWINVSSPTSQGHWIPAEGDRLEELLQTLVQHGLPPGEILLLTPFRDVAKHLYPLARKYHPYIAHTGTIHVAQGKEAEAAILVLGGNPSRPGAKRWASEKPNLLNVAASRGKRRFYVIGNREVWRKYSFFSRLAKILD